MTPEICVFFKVHQPLRLKKLSIFGSSSGGGGKPGVNNSNNLPAYFDDDLNGQIFRKVAEKCYLPTNKLLLDLLHEYDGRFRISFSLTGIFMEQCAAYEPRVLDGFERLADTGLVDFLAETYHHSISSIFADKTEFKRQVEMHDRAISGLCGKRGKPRVFGNTEALFSNEIAGIVHGLGYKGMLTEGTESVLGRRSPNYVYSAKETPGMKVLLRNYKLSDDVSYRFSARWWPEWPLTADKYAQWLSKCPGQCVNLYMDYETFGEHQWKDTGIFDFLRHMPGEALKAGLEFRTASEAVEMPADGGELDVPHPITWADMERDASAWLGNDMQRACFEMLQDMGPLVHGRPELENTWRMLQASDHLYYICTKSLADGDVHKYFSPYSSPYESFINYMNVLCDFKNHLMANHDEKGSEQNQMARQQTQAMKGSSNMQAASAQCPSGKEFVFRMPSGPEVARARCVDELRSAMERVPLESVLYHANGGHFAPWLKMLGENLMANNVSQVKGSGELVRRTLIATLLKK